ncbi:M14 family metallopeptidase [Gracilibacillus kekensis]|uniref:Gamma-D-glutamyl-(L)-meso-diaminopimelate peptidase I Metallo peptidase. MEROPS family M14C n=1 Tax=Gracilibacillus kekensis TaxID=1027249 RepID=A0A1M7PY33_9BACI|nr:M14 family metallopeptidase [Gracilibacillus kekensis]SHN22629.1 gamma-D-glutamyl-{L}-meso-diaminopimelate peptidase I Metallo peptidase. MEROPS family M14C [Gracilibacillus kekensis]
MKVSVRKGDSFWYFSQLFQIPLPLIKASNPDLNPNQLAIGQEVNIPGFVLQNYVIQKNDTLWHIAQNMSFAVDALLLLNPTIQPTQLQIGQKLILPQRVTDLVLSNENNYSYQKMMSDIQQLVTIYPFIQTQIIGKSVLEKDIVELLIGIGPRQKHTNGSFHANEWITTPVIMRFINEYVLALTNNNSIRGLNLLPFFESNTFSLVPMVNPDGVDLVLNGAEAAGNLRESVLSLNDGSNDFSRWKANINGVDLNNQYPALWDTEAARKPTSPGPRDFPGYQPLTEPEAIAMEQLAQQRPFEILNALHTQGEVIFWGFQGLEPPESQTIVEEFSRVSGYQPIQYVDSFAGYKDWYIQEFQRPGYTVELGMGVNPLPISQFEEIYQETLGIMLATLYL